MINFNDDSSNAAVRILNEVLPQDPRRLDTQTGRDDDDPTVTRSSLVDAVGGAISVLPVNAGTTSAGKIPGTAYNTFNNINLRSQLASDDSVIAMQTVNAVQQTAINAQGLSPSRKLSIQPLPMGFGSYLDNILPENVAVAAGAFSAAMQQVKNIRTVPIEKFAQVVGNIESTKDLPLIGGTNVPVNTTLASAGTSLIALGSGPNGTYTMSNLFGAMSGLPYPWAKIESNVKSLQTSALTSIYRELFLAATWERATASVQYTTYTDGFGTTYYHVTGVTLTDAGGGYGRGGAAAPAVTMTGGSCTTTIGTDDTNAGSNGSGTFGRVISLNFTSGSDITTVPTISIDYPPGGTSFPDSIVQDYIDAANAEILSIRNNNINGSKILNDYYNQTGTALRIEQQSRQLCYAPVPEPKDSTLSQFPSTLYAFIDAIPTYAMNTLPHMFAQTLEAICDKTLIGGQSIIGMMRQERNQARLLEAGIQLDNNISGDIDPISTKILIANGVLTTAQGTTPVSNMYPAPDPIGLYDPNTDDYYVINTGAIEGTNESISIGEPSGVDGSTGIVVTPIPNALATGSAQEPGSLAGSNYQSLIPPQLNTAYTSDILPSSVYSVKEAIEQVIKCNCDCWIS